MQDNKIINILIFILGILLISSSVLYAGPFTNTNIQEPLGTNGVFASSIAFGDIDNDGDLDLALTGRVDPVSPVLKFIIFQNNNGFYTNIQEPIGIDQGFYLSSLAFGDIDNDNDLDLAVSGISFINKKFLILENNSGLFTILQEPMGTDKGLTRGALVFKDIDLDSDLDLAITGISNSIFEFIIFNNNDMFYEAQNPMGNHKGFNKPFVTFGDIDNDGDFDLALIGLDQDSIKRFIIFENNAGIFTKKQEPMNSNKGVRNGSIAFGDIDNDGDLDLALTGEDNNFDERFIIFENNAGIFTKKQEPMQTNNGLDSSSIAFGDIDNDGDLDLAVTGKDRSAKYRFIIFQNNNGIFTNVQEPIGPEQGLADSSTAFGDIDNDGDLDLAVTGIAPGNKTHFIIFYNLETNNNYRPSEATDLKQEDVNGFWKLQWNSANDDHTSPTLMRYKLAIGTNQSGVYDYISEAIDLPAGQANVGNIPNGWINTTCIYQSKIPVTQRIYWKVAAIDTSFKYIYSQEQMSPLPETNLIINNFNNIVLGPNPFKPYSFKGRDYVTFFNVPFEFDLKVYSIGGGEIVHIKAQTNNGMYHWNVTNQQGNSLKSGVYICYLKDNQGHEKYLKLVVIR